MKQLVIKWQRLIDNNKTCPRCGETEKEIENAIFKLKKSFNPLGIEVIFKKYELSVDEFNKAPLSSNQILINNKTLEEWLNAKVGQSQCCDVCGDEDCRTIEFLGKTYETIPETLIIKACLLAASEIIENKPTLLAFHVER